MNSHEGLERIILTDAELALSGDEPVFQGLPITAFGTFGGDFRNFHDMMVKRQVFEATLNANIKPWQFEVAPPAYLIYVASVANRAEPVTIFGRVYTPDEAYNHERGTGAEHLEASDTRKRVTSALSRNWLWGMFYSIIEAHGEWGAIHRSMVEVTISEQAFEVAKASGWHRPWQRPGDNEHAHDEIGTGATGSDDTREA